MSETGVDRFQAIANVPLLRDGSSLCFGRIGRLSSNRRPAANGAAKVMTTVWRIGATTWSLWPPVCSESASTLPVFSS